MPELRNILKAIQIARGAMPDVADVPFSPQTAEEQSAGQAAVGSAGRVGDVYRRSAGSIGYGDHGDDSPEEIAPQFAHELTHARQDRSRGLLQRLSESIFGRPEQNIPYNQRGSEMEAYQADADMRVKLGLPGRRSQPSFSGDPVNPYDIQLKRRTPR